MNRTILHLDMNAFFASVEQAVNPFLRGKPVVVGGGIKKTSVVAAASYEAKAKGVKNGMSTWDAKKLCPDLVIIEGDMAKYISTSKAVMKHLSTYTDLVEVFSIDEAWMDVTDIKARYGDEVEITKAIKGWIRKNLNLTCNIGISYNKLMAKFAGELKKPDAIIILRPEDIPSKVKDVPVKELCGVGRKLEEYLAELGVHTFGELNSIRGNCWSSASGQHAASICGIWDKALTTPLSCPTGTRLMRNRWATLITCRTSQRISTRSKDIF